RDREFPTSPDLSAPKGRRGERVPRGFTRGPASSGARSGLRRHADVLVLTDDVVVRRLRIVLDLKDADDAVLEIAVLVERDRTLQSLEIGGLHGVPHVRAVDRLAALDHALDGVDDDERAVIGGDRIVARRVLVRLLELLHESLGAA